VSRDGQAKQWEIDHLSGENDGRQHSGQRHGATFKVRSQLSQTEADSDSADQPGCNANFGAEDSITDVHVDSIFELLSSGG
jgi:hypothetical protein